MTEPRAPYMAQCTRLHDNSGSICPDCGIFQRNRNAPTRPISGVTYVNDVPEVREYLLNLRRDLLRKVRDLDELIARMSQDKSST